MTTHIYRNLGIGMKKIIEPGLLGVFLITAIVTLWPAPLLAGQDELLAAMDMKPYPQGWDAPAFSTKTIDGHPVTNADFRGRVLLVNFWATWCVPCRREMAQFEELLLEFRARGLRVIGINVMEDEAKIRHFAKLYGVSFPLLLDKKGSITKLYGVVAFPTTFLIGRDGKPFSLAVGERDWSSDAGRALIDALLKKSPGK